MTSEIKEWTCPHCGLPNQKFAVNCFKCGEGETGHNWAKTCEAKEKFIEVLRQKIKEKEAEIAELLDNI